MAVDQNARYPSVGLGLFEDAVALLPVTKPHKAAMYMIYLDLMRQ